MLTKIRSKFLNLSKSKKIAIIIITLMILWLLSGLLVSKNIKSDEATDKALRLEEVISAIEVRLMREQKISQEVTMYGVTEPSRYVRILSESDGKIVSIGAQDGHSYKKSAVLLRLDPDGRAEALEGAEAKLKQEKIEYKAAIELYEKSLGSEVELARAKTELKMAESQYVRAREDLNNRYISMPFDGMVDKINVELGDFVKKGDTEITTVVNLDPLIITGKLSENKRRNIMQGAKVMVELRNKTTLDGVLKFISSVADSKTRSFMVQIEVKNPGNSIPAGVSAKAKINAGDVYGYIIPASMMVNDDDGNLGVMVLSSKNIVKFHPIEVNGEVEEGFIVMGLPETIKIVTKGKSLVSHGLQLPKDYVVKDYRP